MPMRMTRGIFIREVPINATKVISVEPVFNGEDLGNFSGVLHTASLPTSQDQNTNYNWLGPQGFLELNITTLFVPFHLAATYTGGVDSTGQLRASPALPASNDDWDNLGRRLLLEFGTDGNEYYGANPDDRSEYDAVRNIWFRRRGKDTQDATPQGGGETGAIAPAATAADRPQDEPLIESGIGPTMGPLGIKRLYSKEMLLRPSSATGVTRNILSSLITGLLGQSFGLVDLVHGSEQDIQFGGPLGTTAGFILTIAHRYDVPSVSASPQFSIEWDIGPDDPDRNNNPSGLSNAQKQSRARALNMMFGGDVERVQAEIRYDNTFLGDYIRSVLFGGDQMIEEPGAWTANLFGSDESLFGGSIQRSYLRPNTIVVAMKKAATILTNYTSRLS